LADDPAGRPPPRSTVLLPWWPMLSAPRRVQNREACRRDEFAPAVQLAYHLVGASNPTTIRSVTVVGGRRLTGHELLRLREEAEASNVLLTMDITGTVRLHHREHSTRVPYRTEGESP
jgi:hypothetical protein